MKDELTYPRKMLVRDGNEDAVLRTVVAEDAGKYIARSQTTKNLYIPWNFAKEVPKFELPVIQGYTGKLTANNSEVRYGCAIASIPKLRKLLELQTLSTVTTITGISIGTINIPLHDIKAIIDHVNSLKIIK